jgi:hypothetical protein
VAVEREVSDQALELAVLLAQLPQLTQLVQSQPRVLLLPDVVRRFVDPGLLPENTRDLR